MISKEQQRKHFQGLADKAHAECMQCKDLGLDDKAHTAAVEYQDACDALAQIG
jgi:hypothetical protein